MLISTDAWEENKHPRAENGQFGNGGNNTTTANEGALREISAMREGPVKTTTQSFVDKAAKAGLRLTRVSRSGKSDSTYLSFEPADGSVLHLSKSARRVFAEKTGRHPRADFSNGIQVRVSDHHNYHDGPTNEDFSIRTDKEPEKAVDKSIDAVQLLMELSKDAQRRANFAVAAGHAADSVGDVLGLDKGWMEKLHPRGGNKDNPGQFSSAGGGGGTSKAESGLESSKQEESANAAGKEAGGKGGGAEAAKTAEEREAEAHQAKMRHIYMQQTFRRDISAARAGDNGAIDRILNVVQTNSEVFMSLQSGSQEKQQFLARAFETQEHLEILEKAFEPGGDGRRSIKSAMANMAKTPIRVASFIAKEEGKTWYAGTRGMYNAVRGKSVLPEQAKAMERIALHITTMAAVATMSGTVGEWLTGAGLSVVASEFVSHTLSEHVAKFTVAGGRLAGIGVAKAAHHVMGKDEELSDEPVDMSDKDLLVVLMKWVEDAVDKTNLQPMFTDAQKGLAAQT